MVEIATKASASLSMGLNGSSSLSDGRTPPEPVKWLMQLALGLPEQLTAGAWTPSELDNRGLRKAGTDRGALSAARL